MRNFPGLVRRESGVYYVRVRVPQDLVPVLERRELKKSLETNDVRQARIAYQRVYAELLRSLNEARDRLSGQAGGPAVPKDVLVDAVRQWFFSLWERCERTYVAPAPDQESLDHMLYQAKFELQELAQPDDSLRGSLLLQARKLLADRGYAQPDAPALADLASYIVRGLRLINVRLIDHFEHHKFHPAIDDPLFQTSGVSKPDAPAKGASLDELIALFYADPQRKKLSPKNQRGFAMAFRLLREIAGASTPAAQVSREHARRVQDLLGRLPPNATKRFPRRTLEQAAQAAKERSLRLLERKTAENILRNLSAFFSWAKKEHHLDRNPFEGLRPLQDAKPSEETRQPFDEASLVKMFGSALYSKDDVSRERYPGRYWIPLLALYHGARSNELCQLEVNDIATTGDIPVICVRKASANGQTKRLKTLSAEREIPIHPKVLALGFMEFVERQRKAGSAVLFPDVPVAATGYRSDNFQKWFARFRSSLGLTDHRMTFHSFRHNFSDAARVAGIPGEIVDELAGWSSGKSMRRHYGSGHPVVRKRDELARISYPAVEGVLGLGNPAESAAARLGSSSKPAPDRAIAA